MRITKKFYIAAASLVVAVGALVALNVTGTPSQAVSSFRNCNPDAIIKCGAITEAELLQKYDQNVQDVQSVYKHYGITRGDLAGTASQIKHGTVYRDGRVVVDGKTVATGAYSVSRVKYTSAGQPRNVVINGTTYYEGPSMQIFTGAVDAFVYMRNGQFHKAALSSCGNPLIATPPPAPKPVYKCESLNATKIDRTRFRFTSAASATNGAEIVSYTYNFGDGNSQTGTNTIEHTYAQPGTYTVTVVANVKVGDKIVQEGGPNCQTKVTVEEKPVEPVYACEGLTASRYPNTRRFRFMASASATNAQIVSYNYNFGDGTTITGSSIVDHEYARPGTYTATVTVNVRVNGQIVIAESPRCKTTVKVEEEPVKPTYKCEGLESTQITRTNFRFTTDTAVTGGAKAVKYTYDFGDGSKTTTESATITHNYAKAGTYTATVVVTFLVDGKEVQVPVGNCKTKVTVKEEPVKPVYKCESLTARPIQTKERAYAYTLSYFADGGATLSRVTYDFGDNTSETFTAANAINVEHTFAQAGNFTTTATLYFNVPENGSTVEKSDSCEVKITVTVPEAPCPTNPNLPKDSPDCGPCPYNPELPKDSPECVETPPELPKTGMDMFIGGSLGVSSIAAASYYWAGSRRNLLDALLNK